MSMFRSKRSNLPLPGKAWEACLTLNDNWGYHAGDLDYKTPKSVIKLLLTTASDAGNLVLNVEFGADGVIPEESARIIREAGQWLKRNPGFLSESDRNPFSWNNTCKITVKGSRIYLHFLADPRGRFCLSEIKENRILAVRFLVNGQSIVFQQIRGSIFSWRIYRRLCPTIPSPRLKSRSMACLNQSRRRQHFGFQVNWNPLSKQPLR